MRFKSIKQVLYKVLRNPLLADTSYDDIAMMSQDFVRLLGAPQTYLDKVSDITISNGRGELPCDLHLIKQTRAQTSPTEFRSMRYATSSFTSNCHTKSSNDLLIQTDLVYSIQGNYIDSSIESGTIQMAYKALAVDEDGYPMIPDNVKAELAFEFYIKSKVFEVLADLGKIDIGTLQRAEQNYVWYMGAAQNNIIMPDGVDEMDSIFAPINRILRNNRQRDNFFDDASRDENFNVNAK